jgi:hypothetical protein
LTEPIKYRLNLIGNGINIYVLCVPYLVWDSLLNKVLTNKRSISEVLCEKCFLSSNNWIKLYAIAEHKGLVLDNRSWVEFKQQNKKIVKLLGSEINNSNFLFPLYEIRSFNFLQPQSKDSKTLLFGTLEKGQIAQTDFYASTFNLAELDFLIYDSSNTFKMGNVLMGISLLGNQIKFKASDTVERSLLFFELEYSD